MTTQEFIRAHRTDDVRRLALRGQAPEGVDMGRALRQIAGWQAARTKLPTLAATDGIEYPVHLSMEQCSSEATARYKAQLMARLVAEATGRPLSACTLADITGGFGIDFMFMSRGFGRAAYIERDAALCAAACHNFTLLGMENATVECGDGAAYIAATPHVDALFADPARRDGHGGRTVAIADCTPDVAALLPTLLARATLTMVKLSPMLDWHKAVADLGGHVAEIHIVGTGGECKELLLVLSAAPVADPRIVCASDGQAFATTAAATRMPCPTVDGAWDGTPGTGGTDVQWFLYEPNATVMKAGAFGAVAAAFGLRAVAANSHLFVGTEAVGGFPGRRFRITDAATMNKRRMRALAAACPKANVAVRNFPLTADALRRKLGIADGGDTYIFGTTTAAGSHILLACKRF